MKLPMMPQAPAMPAVKRPSVKPSLRTRHIKLGARGAFPPQTAAFGAPAAAADPSQAFAGQPPDTAGPGDQGE